VYEFGYQVEGLSIFIYFSFDYFNSFFVFV